MSFFSIQFFTEASNQSQGIKFPQNAFSSPLHPGAKLLESSNGHGTVIQGIYSTVHFLGFQPIFIYKVLKALAITFIIPHNAPNIKLIPESTKLIKGKKI